MRAYLSYLKPKNLKILLLCKFLQITQRLGFYDQINSYSKYLKVQYMFNKPFINTDVSSEKDSGGFKQVEYAFQRTPNNLGRVLDLGCGNGFWAKELEKKAEEVIAIDAIKEFVDIAKKKYGVDARQMDMHELKFREKYFDCVFATGVLEHLFYPDKALSEIHRILKPEGHLLAFASID